MTTQGEKHMDEILRELIASGEISAPVSDDVADHFLSKTSATVPANLKKKAERAFMTARFKAIMRKANVVARPRAEAVTFGGYLSLVLSALKTPVDIAAEACRVNEQAFRAIQDAAQDVSKVPVQVLVGIIDGFSIPTSLTATLLRNTLAVVGEKKGAIALPRADSKTQSITGALEAGLLAIAKANGKMPSATVDAKLLDAIKDELGKLGRADLLR